MVSTVLLDQGSAIAHLMLNRPAVSNAVDLLTARHLLDAVRQIAGNPTVRVVVVRSAGARFCAGGDLAAMTNQDDPHSYVRELALTMDAALQQLSELTVPVIVAVQGAVAGAGLALMLSCDLVVAARSATFTSGYGPVGLTPDCGLSYQLPRAVGQQRALDLLLTTRVLDAETALTWGLVNQVVADDQLASTVTEIADGMSARPRFALGAAKSLVRSSWRATRAETGVREADVIAEAFADNEAQQLIKAFQERRSASR